MELVFFFLFILFCVDPNNFCSCPLLCSVNGSERKRVEVTDKKECERGHARGPSAPGELEHGHFTPAGVCSLRIGKELCQGPRDSHGPK